MASILARELLANQNVNATTTGESVDILTKDVNFIGHLVVTNASVATAEITSITAIADVSASLDGTYFILQDDVGSVAFWIDIDDSGTTIPAGASAADRAIEITTLATNDSAATVGTAVYTAVIADSKFVAGSAASTPIVTVKASTTGIKTAGADGDTGFTIAVDTAGDVVASYAAEIQHSHDGSNWFTLLDFTAVSVDVAEVIHVDNTTVHVMRFIRTLLTKTTGDGDFMVDLLYDRL